jgi:glycosyltransferase involved in cell wall biosynthesis
MKKDLIIFGEDWGALPSSTQHLVTHFRDDRRVLWVNSIGLRQPRPRASDIRRAMHKLTRGAQSRPSASTPNPGSDFHILNPITLPAPSGRMARRIARSLLQSQLDKKVDELGLRDPVLWISLPTAVDMVGRLRESAVIYYCGDDFSSLAGVDHHTVSKRERELVERADLVFAASDELVRKFPRDKTHLVSHGVDFELFARPARRAPDLPHDGRPVAGFYGSISEWFDLELLEGIARRLPDWHFVIIGHSVIDVSRLQRLDNLLLLGPRAHARLPEYSQHWTASILPFRDNAQIRACNPLKLREYLAAGRPVISTTYPAAAAYADVMTLADDVEGFVRALRVARKTPASSLAQRERVRMETWQARASVAEQLMEAL